MAGELYISNKQHPELDFLGFRWIKPHPVLRPYISCYWYIDANLKTCRTENFYPDGGSGLMFNFANPIENHGQSIVEGVFQNVDVIKSEVTFKGATQALGVRFLPGGAQAFLNCPLGSLQTSLILLRELSSELSEMGSLLGEIKSWAQRINYLDSSLLRLRMALPNQNLIEHYRTALKSTFQGPTMGTFADGMGISDRKLQRTFKDQVGLTPKTLFRLYRIEQVRKQLKQRVLPPLTQIAYDAGFYDQAHFIRDFKQVVGMTPGAYRQRAESRVLYPFGPSAILTTEKE